jgi:phospholipid/cholesterol/gamma-HCH transport system permease protein
MKSASEPNSPFHIEVSGREGQEITLAILGRIVLADLPLFDAQIAALVRKQAPGKVTVDLAGLEYLDSAGALALLEFQSESQARAVPVAFVNPTDRVKGIMGLIDPEALKTPPLIAERGSDNVVEQLGEGARRFASDLFEVTTFLGELLIALFQAMLRPRSVRWQDVAAYMKKAGVDGLPIVGLLSFLLGLIIAFMSSLQLKQFGANIYVASLLAIGMVKELGPIMTAILVAGRSGSAFAAEIGTMKVNEEVDALVTMGFDPIRFLALPKVLAAMVVVPLLTLYADLFGIIGGLVVGVVGLDLTVYAYLKETQTSLTLLDVILSLIKAGVFAVLIAGIGCQRGFQVRGGAEAVGSATTSAVVSALFLIIVTDSAFALAFQYLGI